MNFKEALKILDIEDYGEKIFNSNSHGELFHISEYIYAAQKVKETDMDISWFRDFFVKAVEFAEEKWERPESVYQHIFTMLSNQ